MNIVQPLYEDNHLLIVNKPSGILVQGDHTGDKPLVEYCKDYLKEKYNKPGAVFCGVVHRIDRPTSGIVVFARTSKALERMNALFKNRKVQKTYWAIVKRRPKEQEDKLVHWLKKDNKRNTTAAFDKEVDGALKADLTYRTIGKLNDHWLLEVKPITGRPHQIRVQLSTIGSPIRGDLRYGFAKANTDRSINLHARSIYFEHPVKKEGIAVRAEVPADQFWEQFLTLPEVKASDKKLGKAY